ncbi:MAG: hypothetical protein PHT94_02100 [Candidatus Nanoarchaeia archaeon]|nr:hypothetical protein [Candidatus Nanoarchaeia archaeon]
MEFNIVQICEKTYEIKLKDTNLNSFLEKVNDNITLKNKFFTQIKIEDITIKVFKDHKIIANSNDLKTLNKKLSEI